MRRGIVVLMAVACLAVVGMSIPSISMAADPTSRFVLTAVKLYLDDNYPGSTIAQNSPVSTVQLDGKTVWYTKALFSRLGAQHFGEFWVDIFGKRPTDLKVVKANIRAH